MFKYKKLNNVYAVSCTVFHYNYLPKQDLKDLMQHDKNNYRGFCTIILKVYPLMVLQLENNSFVSNLYARLIYHQLIFSHNQP